MPVCWEGRKCPLLNSNLAVNSKIATIGVFIGFEMLRVSHICCHGAVVDFSSGLNSQSVRSLCALTVGPYMFIISPQILDLWLSYLTVV